MAILCALSSHRITYSDIGKYKKNFKEGKRWKAYNKKHPDHDYLLKNARLEQKQKQ